ncbi:MAG: MBOAT family O-acyltransferase [Fibrobacteraceae bacterium]|jgi:D-alanyl-lipoteichoic acid acyltransferase DltB (MBOAT superfamily)|nr:MBOAT family O-acyltransferase [Fibrobacteraceae bacterium]
MEQLIPYLTKIFSFDQETPLLFTQFYFWGFFAIVFAVFALIHKKLLLRNAFLFFVSLFFYYKTSGSYLCILIFTVIFNFLLAKRIHVANSTIKKKLWMILVVIVNLLTLSYFKYAYFFLDVINNIFHTDLRVYNFFAAASNKMFKTTSLVDTIILPVGISFFIFQAISYCVDVYRQKVKPVSNILDFGFYLTFFPQLVAGPIVRADVFIPQLYKTSYLSKRSFGIAVFWILNGLAKKIIMSDYLSTNFVDRVFDNPLLFSGFENLLALFAYSLQVYADFSGYTDIAIGVALLMGFHLPRNFNSPYKALTPTDFWRRWHMSLSSWLRDYLYIPLGGNRRASFGTFFWIAIIAIICIILSESLLVAVAILTLFIYLAIYAALKPSSRKFITTNMNAMTTQLLGGLWHGASWNFMIWGGLNGFGQVVNKIWVKYSVQTRAIAIFILCAVTSILSQKLSHPLLTIIAIWSATIFVGVYCNMVFRIFTTKTIRWIYVSWNVFLTFVFITFTRLFFRAGSNLDPAEANDVAWDTATKMIQQIGSPWNTHALASMAYEYKNIIGVFFLGMIIHWLPENFKRRYRIAFASLPRPIQILGACLAVFFIYQFMSADSQPFIYFQF